MFCLKERNFTWSTQVSKHHRKWLPEENIMYNLYILCKIIQLAILLSPLLYSVTWNFGHVFQKSSATYTVWLKQTTSSGQILQARRYNGPAKVLPLVSVQDIHIYTRNLLWHSGEVKWCWSFFGLLRLHEYANSSQVTGTGSRELSIRPWHIYSLTKLPTQC